jgi:hypothetical protein
VSFSSRYIIDRNYTLRRPIQRQTPPRLERADGARSHFVGESQTVNETLLN